MAEIRWIRVAITTVIMLAVLAAVTYWQAQNNPINATEIALNVPGCTVKWAHDGSRDVIHFGAPRCPT